MEGVRASPAKFRGVIAGMAFLGFLIGCSDPTTQAPVPPSETSQKTLAPQLTPAGLMACLEERSALENAIAAAELSEESDGPMDYLDSLEYFERPEMEASGRWTVTRRRAEDISESDCSPIL
jgi:hypothetical protein